MDAFKNRLTVCFLGVLIFLGIPGVGIAESLPKEVLLLHYHGVIDSVSDGYLSMGLARAKKDHDSAVVLELDTPGGLDTSMRSMVKNILASPVPVIVYVGPSGSRSASAGVFIVYASSLAAMAPGTNIGAAHPVFLGGLKPDRTLSRKIENDAVAYIKALAVKRGRNAQWGMDAVKKSVSIDAGEALKKGVIDLVVPDLPTLFEKAEGRTVQTGSGKMVLHLTGAQILPFPLPLGLQVMQILSHPQIAFLLMLFGFWGLVFEFSQPGGVFPGVFGALCLLLSIYAFHLFPFHLTGILMILLGFFFLLLEIKVPSYGILTAGGLISLILGGVVLGAGFPSYFRVPVPTIVAIAIITTLFLSVFVRQAWKTFRLPSKTGKEAMIGEQGVALTNLDQDGEVRFHGEDWQAHAEEPIEKGTPVLVTEVEGLTLHVQRKK